MEQNIDIEDGFRVYVKNIDISTNSDYDITIDCNILMSLETFMKYIKRSVDNDKTNRS